MSRHLASRLLAVALSAAAATVTGFLSPRSVVGESVADSLSREVRVVFERSRNAVVKIEASDGNGQLRGTGFFIDPEGTVLTSYSVGGESKGIIVVHGDLKYPARRLISDWRSGIAILKVEKVDAPTAFLPISSSTNLTVATPVVSVAYPMDMPLTPNFGMVAGFNVKYLDRYFVTTHIRANVPVQRGEGGAPLLNMHGEVVGVVISSVDGGAGCFALPIEAAEKIHRDYIRFGVSVPRSGWFGVVLKEAGIAREGSTAEVDALEQGGPASKAGLLVGDIVLKIGNTAVKSWQDVQDAAFYLTAGETVSVVVWRNDEAITLQVDLGERPALDRNNQPLRATVLNGLNDITLRLPGKPAEP